MLFDLARLLALTKTRIVSGFERGFDAPNAAVVEIEFVAVARLQRANMKMV
jgi:hypothetical protein